MSKILLFGILLFGMVSPGYSQLLSFGVKAGVPLNDGLNGTAVSNGVYTNQTDRWIVGPTAEVHLPLHLSFEVDALYRRESFTNLSYFNNKSSLNNWQFPFLAKYEVKGEVLRPFVDAGISYRHLSGDTFITNPNSAGFTVGGGLAVKLLFLHLSPELRYTRWGSESGLGNLAAVQNRNQADFMLGFTF